MTFDNFITYSGYLVAVLTAIISMYRSYKAGKGFAEITTILVTTLKDEGKMIDGQFSPATLQKAQEVANTISADSIAVEQVKSVLRGRESDIKLGSYKGKPVYLSDAIGFSSIARGIFKIFRK